MEVGRKFTNRPTVIRLRGNRDWFLLAAKTGNARPSTRPKAKPRNFVIAFSLLSWRFIVVRHRKDLPRLNIVTGFL